MWQYFSHIIDFWSLLSSNIYGKIYLRIDCLFDILADIYSDIL